MEREKFKMLRESVKIHRENANYLKSLEEGYSFTSFGTFRGHKLFRGDKISVHWRGQQTSMERAVIMGVETISRTKYLVLSTRAFNREPICIALRQEDIFELKVEKRGRLGRNEEAATQ